MTKEADEIVVAGTGTVWVAPYGTALPTTEAAAPHAAFFDLGYTTEGGVKISKDEKFQGIPAWQSLDEVRRLRTERELMITTELLQFSRQTLLTAMGGGTVTKTGNTYKYVLPAASAALEELSLIVDFVDGQNTFRHVFPRVTINDGVELTGNRKDATTLPLAFKALAPDVGDIYQLLTNSPSLQAGS